MALVHGCCRVQFDRRELGVELVKDVDVMPIDPTENLPSIFAPMMVSVLIKSQILHRYLPGALTEQSCRHQPVRSQQVSML